MTTITAIWMPEGVTIELTALPGAELLTSGSSYHWSNILPCDHKTDTRCVVECRDRKELLIALGLEPPE